MDIELMKRGGLAEGESCSVQLPRQAGGYEGFIVRKGERVFGYVNRCPHTGAPLDWMPNQFLDARGEYIICAVHGALFEIETGLCVQGPCVNRLLEPLTIALVGDRLVLRWSGAESPGSPDFD